MKINNKFDLLTGIILTLFNIGVLIFTSNNIYPRYFEWLFAFYFMIGTIVGAMFIRRGLKQKERKR